MVASVYRRHRLLALTAMMACLAGGCGFRTQETPPLRVAETRRCMGVSWTITVCVTDRATGLAAIAAAFSEVVRLERILSDYDPTSELSRLSATSPSTTPVAVSDDLWAVLVRAATIADDTDGAFDVTVGPLTTLWRQSRRSGHLPRPDKLAAARAAVGTDAIVLDAASRSVSLSRPAMRLDPGGIGMGYAADRVLAVLAGQGIASAMVDASGDVAVSAAPPGTAGWRIAVAPLPGAGAATGGTLLLKHAAVTTSGDANQAVEIDGRRYSHVVDPRTGMGVAGPAAVTVIAPDCTTADALATAANVLGPEAGPAAIARFPGCSARFTWREDDATRSLTTPGWPIP
ncbi:MAG: FAD:protein FMN transferase [Planctomycetia bacterium]|nr:FAD:protein FMN transferase [Planctomycetia bacterium]